MLLYHPHAGALLVAGHDSRPQKPHQKCGHCRKYEAAPPIVPMKPLTCSGPGELLHVDFTSIEETVPLKEEPVIQNVLALQDHFSKLL